jgi:GTP:adenosylcobinamide-phosphate guanylyltransferase
MRGGYLASTVRRVPAIVAAGDAKAARAVYGESKAYLEVGGRSMIARIVSVLQRVPEVSEVWVVGHAERLEKALAEETLRGELVKPLWIVPQYRNLYENAWYAYRRLLPGAGAEGRDPTPEEMELPVLYLSTDLPFATPQELSEFVRKGLAANVDYVLGLVTEHELEPFYPQGGEPGIRMAYFNLREGRFRQSNLHLVKPAKLGNRQYIEDMYEHRYQRQVGQALGLAWRIFMDRGGGVRVLFYYGLMHLAGVLDRRGMRRLADAVRRTIAIQRVERACGALLRASFRFVITGIGGCALDVDNEHDLDIARQRFAAWERLLARTAEAQQGPLPLPPEAGRGAAPRRVLPPGPQAT